MMDYSAAVNNAGLSGLPISWDSDGNLYGREILTSEQNKAFDAALAAYDPLAAIKSAACVRIDVRAETLRQSVLTPGAGQMAAYQAKEAQAKALLQDGDPTEGEYPDIYNEIGITADTVHEVAMAVLAAAEKWRLYGRNIEKVRLTGKKAVNAATDGAGVTAAETALVWPEG